MKRAALLSLLLCSCEPNSSSNQRLSGTLPDDMCYLMGRAQIISIEHRSSLQPELTLNYIDTDGNLVMQEYEKGFLGLNLMQGSRSSMKGKGQPSCDDAVPNKKIP